MKTCVLVVCIAAALWAEANADCPSRDDPLVGTNDVPEGTIFYDYENCLMHTCTNGGYVTLGCARPACKGQTGLTPHDYSKAYPECCPRPIYSKKH